jgi:hypothetical protein
LVTSCKLLIRFPQKIFTSPAAELIAKVTTSGDQFYQQVYIIRKVLLFQY